MSQAYVGDQVGIRSTSDTVEQVKEALGARSGIREDTPDDEETPGQDTPDDDAEPGEGDEEAPTGDEDDDAKDDEGGEGEGDDEPEAKAKPKPKSAMPVVPRARLNEEIRKRKALEIQLAAKGGKVEPDAPAPEVKPVTYCGRPKPTIAQFTADAAKYPDPYAAHAEACGEWFADERDAKRTYEANIETANRKREAEYASFNASVAETLKRRPDYNDVVDGSQVQVSDRMADFITKEAAIGAEILLHLVENPDEAERIRDLSTREQKIEMFALEATLMEELGIADEDEVKEPIPPKKSPVVPKKSQSKTPPPPTRLKGAGPGVKSLQDLAGPVDREGVRIEYNPAYTAAVKARRGT